MKSLSQTFEIAPDKDAVNVINKPAACLLMRYLCKFPGSPHLFHTIQASTNTIFCGHYPLDTQDLSSYTRSHEKENSYQFDKNREIG